jgi:hypothetical protein
MATGLRLTALAALWLAGCGYVGDPLPPSLKIPRAVADLTAVERGDKLIVEFTLPELTTDGVRLARLGEIDLRVGAEGVRPWNAAVWEAAAARLPVAAEAPGARVRVELPAGGWVGREVILGARVAGPSGRWSDWSNLYALHVARPLPAPSNVAARNAAAGVELSWKLDDDRAGIAFRILRGAPGENGLVAVGETGERRWTDTRIEYGRPYEYRVQALLRVGDDVAESELSAAAAITPEDRFPPASPTGLTAVAGAGQIELSWERVADEPGLTYRLYRSENGGEWKLVAEALTLPGYSDREIAPGKRYTYSVSAVDRLGNESEKSAPVDVVLPESEP